MAKVLLVYYPSVQAPLVGRIVEQMRTRGLEMDSLNLPTAQLNGQPLNTGGPYGFLRRMLSPLLRIAIIRKALSPLLASLLLRRVARGYDMLDFHYFSVDYMPYMWSPSRPYAISIWGSDFYRERPFIQRLKAKLYRRALYVRVATEAMGRDVLSRFPDLDGCIEVANFGVELLEEIDLLRGSAKSLVPESERDGRLVLTCGYNGSPAQRHQAILEAISRLSDTQKERIFLYLPLTYGLTPEYRAELIARLQELALPYRLFEQRLSDGDMALLRLETDVVVNIQTTDALCASLTQHLYAGNVLIAGDWLPYEIYPQTGVYYLPTTIEALPIHLATCIDGYEQQSHATERNPERLRQWASWQVAGRRLYELYIKGLKEIEAYGGQGANGATDS